MLLRCFLLVANIASTTCLTTAVESAALADDVVNASDDPLREQDTQTSVTRAKKKGFLSFARRAEGLTEASVAAALKEEVLTGLYAPVGHLGHCPEGWSIIRSRSECSKAAAYLDFKDRSALERGWPDRPGGCFVHDEHEEVYFNKLMGSVSKEDRQICAAAIVSGSKVGQTLLARTPSAKKVQQFPGEAQATNSSAMQPEGEMMDEGPTPAEMEAQNATLRSESAANKSNQTQSGASAGRNTTAPKVSPRTTPKPELKDTKDGLAPHKMIDGYPHRKGGPKARPLKSANRFKPNPVEYDEDGELKDTPWGTSPKKNRHMQKADDILAKIFNPNKPHAKAEDYDESGELKDTYNGLPASEDYEAPPKKKDPYAQFKPAPRKVSAAKADAIKHQVERARRDRIDRVHAARAAEEAKARRPMEKAAAKEAKARRKHNEKVKEARTKAWEKARQEAERAENPKSKGKSAKAQRFDSGADEDVEDKGGEDPVAQLIGVNESRKLSSEAKKYIEDTLEYKEILAEEMPDAVEKDRKARAKAEEEDIEKKFKDAAAYHASTMKQARAMLRKKAEDHKMKTKAHVQHRRVKLAEPGQRCGEGYEPITNRTICTEAAASLGGEDYTSWPHKFTTRPSGCYMHPQPSASNQPGQRQFNFNPSKKGELNFEDQIVCMKSPEGHKTKLLEVASHPLPNNSHWNQRVEETEVLHPPRLSEEELIGPGEPMWKQAKREQKRFVNDMEQTNKKEQKAKDQKLRTAAKYDAQIKKEADRKLKKSNSVREGHFKLAVPGARCPEYYIPVTNRSLCKQAAKLWEGKDMVDWKKTRTWADRPKGCFIHKVSHNPDYGVLPMEFNFNSGNKGDFNFQDQVVCIDETSKPAREMVLFAPKKENVTAAHAKK